MFSKRKISDKNNEIIQVTFLFFGELSIVDFVYDKKHEKMYTVFHTKEFLEKILNINNYKDLDNTSRIIEEFILNIKRKYIKNNKVDYYYFINVIDNIVDEIIKFLKEFLFLQSI